MCGVSEFCRSVHSSIFTIQFTNVVGIYRVSSIIDYSYVCYRYVHCWYPNTQQSFFDKQGEQMGN